MEGSSCKPISLNEELCEIKIQIKETLIEKNKLYGDSALNPRRVMSKVSSAEGIAIRLDDKINRLLNSPVSSKTKHKIFRKNDVFDTIGYSILYTIATTRESDDTEKSFSKEIDDAIEKIFLPSSDEESLLPTILDGIKIGSIKSEEMFFTCLDKIVKDAMSGEVPTLISVFNLSKLCLYIAAFRNFSYFDDQID